MLLTPRIKDSTKQSKLEVFNVIEAGFLRPNKPSKTNGRHNPGSSIERPSATDHHSFRTSLLWICGREYGRGCGPAVDKVAVDVAGTGRAAALVKLGGVTALAIWGYLGP